MDGYVCALFSAARGLDRHVGDACQSLSLQIGQNSRNNSGQTWRLPKLPQTQNYLRCCCSLHIPCMFSDLFLLEECLTNAGTGTEHAYSFYSLSWARSGSIRLPCQSRWALCKHCQHSVVDCFSVEVEVPLSDDAIESDPEISAVAVFPEDNPFGRTWPVSCRFQMFVQRFHRNRERRKQPHPSFRWEPIRAQCHTPCCCGCFLWRTDGPAH